MAGSFSLILFPLDLKFSKAALEKELGSKGHRQATINDENEVH
jgi:hypothetical protein